jgi:hypothetical protein
MSAPRLLADLGEALGTLGLRWYVFGAQAVVALGRPRMTADVDVTVELGSVTLPTLLEALGSRGFEPAFAFDDAFVETARVVPMRHRATEMPLDVVLAGPGLEELFLDRALELELGGTIVPVIAPEHLVVTKILAGRPLDLEDVHGLRRSGVALDETEIEELLDALETAIGEGGLVARWRTVRDRG